MPAIEELKSAAQAEIDRYGTELIQVAQTILAHPEPGFREWKTSGLTAQKFRDFGLPFQDGIALTGLKAMLDTTQSRKPKAVDTLDIHLSGHL